jgi:hypothetical protein
MPTSPERRCNGHRRHRFGGFGPSDESIFWCRQENYFTAIPTQGDVLKHQLPLIGGQKLLDISRKRIGIRVL